MRTPPDPRRFAHMTDQIVNVLTGGDLALADDYAWLYPSGYHRARNETGERTRREVRGADTGTLGDGFEGLDSVRRSLASAGERVQQALDLLRGARADLRRAQSAVEKSSRPTIDVAEDPLTKVAADRGEMKRLEAARQRRTNRVQGREIQRGKDLRPASPPPWSDEVTG